MDIPVPDPLRLHWRRLLDEQALLLPVVRDRVAQLRPLAAAPPAELWMGAAAIAFAHQAHELAALIGEAATDLSAAADDARVAAGLLDG